MDGSAFAQARVDPGVGLDRRLPGGRSRRATRGDRRPGRRVFRPARAASPAWPGAVSGFSIAVHAGAGVSAWGSFWPDRWAVCTSAAATGPGLTRSTRAAALCDRAAGRTATAVGGIAGTVRTDRSGLLAG